MATNDRIIDTTPLDVRAQPLIDALIDEYATRYDAYRPEQPRGRATNSRATRPICSRRPTARSCCCCATARRSAAAHSSYDAQTAELKRIWTRGPAPPGHRTRSSTRSNSAPRGGAIGASTSTGFRQPEAWALYDRAGYTRLFDASIDPEAYFHLRFGKDLVDPSRTSTLVDLWAPLPEPALPR